MGLCEAASSPELGALKKKKEKKKNPLCPCAEHDVCSFKIENSNENVKCGKKGHFCLLGAALAARQPWVS